MRRAVALSAAGAALAAATVGGVAFGSTTGAASGAPTLTASTAAAPGPVSRTRAGHPRRALAARALHGTFTVARKDGPAVVDVQRGQVTRSDATSVTVRSTDGFEATYRISGSTHVRKDKKPATASALTTGTHVGVVADDAGGHPVARVIRVTR